MAEEQFPNYAVSDVSSRTEYSYRLIETSMWAATRAARAREFGYEWLALGLGLAAAHALFLVAPRGTLSFIDLVIILVTVGGGFTMLRFELSRGNALRELSKKLQAEAANHAI